MGASERWGRLRGRVHRAPHARSSRAAGGSLRRARFALSGQIEVARAGEPGEWVNGRSVLSLLSLAAAFGTRLRVRGVGADAAKAVAALGQVLEQPLEGDGG